MVRVKYRYIVAKIEFQHNTTKSVFSFTDRSIFSCIMKIVQKYYGDLGAAAIRSGFKCKYCNEQTRIIVIRVKHQAHRFITSILPLVTAVGEYIITFRTLYIGATIMQCNKFIVKHQKEFLDKEIGQQLATTGNMLVRNPKINEPFS